MALVIFTAPAIYAQAPQLNGCPSFPPNSIYNTRIDSLPVSPYSNNWINTINNLSGVNHLHANFGSDPYNEFPYATVTGSQRKVPIGFDYADSSDPGPYPIPPNVPIQHPYDPNSDLHALVQDTTNCMLYEIFHVESSTNGVLGPNPDGSWWATQGSVFNLRSNALRPDGWTSANAAGTAILPLQVRYEEMQAGAINHALEITAGALNSTLKGHVWPARHDAGGCSDMTQCVPFGTRFRLKANFDISGFSPTMQILLTALKRYGAFMVDNGGNYGAWFISGVPNPSWNDSDLHSLVSIVSSNLEAVDESSLMINPNTADAVQSGTSTPPPPSPITIPTGWVNIVNKNSGSCVDLILNGTQYQNGDRIFQYQCWGGTNQAWQFVPRNGGYEIVSRLSGLPLNIFRNNPADGQPIVQWQDNGTPDYIWTPIDAGNGYVTLHPNNSGKCMDVWGESKANTAAITQYYCNSHDNERWLLVPVN